MAGMVDTQRDRANRELMDRPLDQRRIGPNGEIGGVIPPPAGGNPPIGGAPAPRAPRPAPVAPGGARPVVPDRLPVSGTRPNLASLGDTTAARTKIDKWVPTAPESVKEWATWVEAGGDLAAIPDVLVNDVMTASDGLGRIRVVGNSGGVSTSYWVHDDLVGRRYVIKSSVSPRFPRGFGTWENLNELMFQTTAERLGVSTARVRLAGEFGPNGTGWVIVEDVANMAKWQGYDVVGSVADFNARYGADVPWKLGKDGLHDAFDQLMTDYITNEMDAHRGNALILNKGNSFRFQPIDHSLAFDGRSTGNDPTRSLVQYLAQGSGNLPTYQMRWLTDGATQGLITEADVWEWINDYNTRVERMILDGINLEGPAGSEAYAAAAQRMVEERSAWLLANPDAVVRHIFA